MTMNNQRSTRLYDLFKLIVALILIALLIILLINLRQISPAVAQDNQGQPVVAALSPSATVQATAVIAKATASPTSAPQAAATLAATATTMPTATQAAPTPTPTAAASTPTPTLTTAVDAPTPTPETVVDTPTPTPTSPNAASDCSAAIPSRLAVGTKARVLSNLNFRSSAGLENNLIRVNPAGTQLEVTGGPTCVRYGNGAYLWWEVRSADGKTGWSAEGSLEGKFYFLEPVK
jgi:cytoskeletal protein RodZ